MACRRGGRKFAAGAYAHTLARFATAFVLGTLIGLERQWRQRTAGLRTNVLVAVGAAAFSDLGMRLLVNWVNRRPITPDVTEAKYIVHATCRPRDVRDLLDAELDRASYPVREVETLSETDAQVELAAVLVPTTADEAELDAVVAALEASPLVLSATWSVEATS